MSGEEPSPRPPQSQEEVVAHVLADLRRRFDTLARAARRVEASEGPAGDAVRAVRDAIRGMGGAAGPETPGTGGADRPREAPRIPPTGTRED